MSHPISPYLAEGFYDKALAAGRHRDIVGGRWDETGRVQMRLLQDAGLQPHHRLLDIGAGSLRLGCKAIPFLHAGNYWATDASRALMLRGRSLELEQPDSLPEDHLIEDAEFTLPGVPDTIDYAIAFGVFTHLPISTFDAAMMHLRPPLSGVKKLLFTVFLAPDGSATGALRQADGVVTHPDRPPYHFRADDVVAVSQSRGWQAGRSSVMLPRGQVLFVATPCA